jgi:hypothetical protein
MKFNQLPCSKAPASLVHKFRDDDVFLYNCRTALPAWFECTSSQIEKLSEEDRKALKECFDEREADHGDSAVRFCLKYLPWVVEAGSQVFHGASEAQRWLEEYYVATPTGHRLCQTAMPEHVQAEMIKAVSSGVISEGVRYRAAMALEKAGIKGGVPIFHCSAYNDTKHYYFYGKRHEHVPGIMLMEIARQAFYAHFYQFSGKTRDAVNLSILSFNCEFRSYLQSNYPIHISVETVWRELDGTSRERQLLRATLRQRGEIACVIEMIGSAVQSKLFARLRDVKTPKEEAFAPISTDALISLLLSNSDSQMYEAKIELFCADTLIVLLTDDQASVQISGSCNFHIFTPHEGIISGSGVMVSDDPRAMDGTVAIRVTSWNKGAAEKYRAFLKMDCYLSESITALAE